MFKRRTKPAVHFRVREFFWPSAGWHRSTRYVFHRVARIPGSAYSLAGGFACGAAISFTPFVGLHFIIAAIMALAIRTNVVASAIGTAVGNPWTFPFIWVWIYNIGIWMVGDGHSGAEHVDFANVFSQSMEALLRFDLIYLFETAAPVLWPMLVGSVPTAIFVWFLFYLPMKPMIARYQSARHHKRTRKAKARKADAIVAAHKAEIKAAAEIEEGAP